MLCVGLLSLGGLGRRAGVPNYHPHDSAALSLLCPRSKTGFDSYLRFQLWRLYTTAPGIDLY